MYSCTRHLDLATGTILGATNCIGDCAAGWKIHTKILQNSLNPPYSVFPLRLKQIENSVET